MKLVPIKEIKTELESLDKINEIIRLLNAMHLTVSLIGSDHVFDVNSKSDNELIERFGEWFPKDMKNN